jgi:uncharacterized Zn finger protein
MAWYRDYYPPSTPIAAKGGIKARTKRGAFASNWWGRRWLDVLEALNLGARLQRGRRYARAGQVLDIDIAPGTVRASVQGSRSQPYRITIGVQQLTKKNQERLAAELAIQPWLLAKLITQEMPQDIERLFDAAKVSLFPARASELETDCSCPDWSNPCKHIAAVYYLLGEEFDRDPFLIFRLRGVETDALLAAAGMAHEADDQDTATVADPAEPIVRRGAAPPDAFWEGSRPELDLEASEPPRTPAPLLRRLGNLPFWRGELPLAEALEPAYTAAFARAVDVLACSGPPP